MSIQTEELFDLKEKAKEIIEHASKSGRDEARLNVTHQLPDTVSGLRRYLSGKGLISRSIDINGLRILVIKRCAA